MDEEDVFHDWLLEHSEGKVFAAVHQCKGQPRRLIKTSAS